MMSSTQASQGSYEGIYDILLCYICMERLKDACMCPHCTKICCYGCIKYWMRTSKANCPHCRAKISESDLIQVPSVQEISDLLDNKDKQRKAQPREKDYCPQHVKEQLTVYCVTCAKCVCSRCALFGDHKQDQGHVVKPLDELYKEQKDILTAELKKLRERMKEVVGLVESVDMKMERVKVEKAKTKQEIDMAIGDIDVRLDDQIRLKLQRLIETRRYLKQQAREIKNLSTELEAKMGVSKSVFISQGKELKDRLVAKMIKLQESHKEELETLPDVGNFVNEVVPAYESSTMQIDNFRELQQKGEAIYSSPLSFCGLSFRLKVLPNGTGEFVGRYLCVFIELHTGYSQTVSYQYSIEMVYGAGHHSQTTNNLTSRNFKRHYSSDFSVGDLWGYKKFYDLSKLENEGYLVKDTLLLKFSLRHPTYHQKCRDLVMYVNDLKHKNMALKYQLRHRCQSTKDVDDAHIPLPPTPQAISCSSTDSSPAHTAAALKKQVGGTQPAHMPHPSVSMPHSFNPTLLSQPVSVYRPTDKDKPYHSITPHSGLVGGPMRPHAPPITNGLPHPLIPDGQRGQPKHHPISKYRTDSGGIIDIPSHVKDNKRLPMEGGGGGDIMTRLPDSYQHTRQQQQPPVRNNNPLADGDSSYSLSLPHFDNQWEGFHDNMQSPPPSPDISFYNEQPVTSAELSSSQLGLFQQSQPILSQEQLMAMESSNSQKMFFEMTQPDMLQYHHPHQHQRLQTHHSNGPLRHKQQQQQQQQQGSPKTKQFDKRMSLTDLSKLPAQSSPGGDMSRHSHSVLTLHDERNYPSAAPPIHRPFHHSQGNISDIHGPRGLMSTMMARLNAPIDQIHSNQSPSASFTLPRNHDNRRGNQQRQHRHKNSSPWQQSSVQSASTTSLNHPHSVLYQQATPRSSWQQSLTQFTIVESPETQGHSPPRNGGNIPSNGGNIPSNHLLQQQQQTQDSQPPKLRSSGRRYSYNTRKVTEPLPMVTIKNDNIDDETTNGSSSTLTPMNNSLTTGHRTSSNTSLAAEII